MGTSILPAQDCLVSYKENITRHGRAYHHVNYLQSETETVHAHRILGNYLDIGRRKTDPMWLQENVASNVISSGKCNRI